MINIQETAVVGKCNEVFVCPGFSSVFVIWILMSADRMQPSITILIDLHRLFSSLTEKAALEQSLERRNLNR
jgi:predicted metal-binding membrane protein